MSMNDDHDISDIVILHEREISPTEYDFVLRDSCHKYETIYVTVVRHRNRFHVRGGTIALKGNLSFDMEYFDKDDDYMEFLTAFVLDYFRRKDEQNNDTK